MSICFIICSAVPIICSAFLIRCSTPFIICAIYNVISCAFVFICGAFVVICGAFVDICGAFVVMCSTFVVICCAFATTCRAFVIICCDISIIPAFCRSIGSVLSYTVVYLLYVVQTILPRVHFALFAVLSSLYGNVVIIYPQCKARVSDPNSSQPDVAILVCFWRESRRLIIEAILQQLGLSTLFERFREEKVDPHVVLAMPESALIRLWVATMGDRIRLKQMCKEAVDSSGDANGADSFNRDSSGSSVSAAEQVREERKLLFRPYYQTGANRGRGASAGRAGQKKKGSKRTWTGQFVFFGGSARMQGTFFS